MSIVCPYGFCRREGEGVGEGGREGGERERERERGWGRGWGREGERCLEAAHWFSSK